CDPPAAIVAVAGLITMWSMPDAVTSSDAVPVFPAFVPVTVWVPPSEAVHVAPVHDPFGVIENVVAAGMSPSELLYWSRPCAVYACDPPEEIDALAGERARWSSGPTVTLSEAVAVLPPSFPVTVCAPETVAVHVAPVHDPFGPIENVVAAVTSPSELFAASKPSAVYACDPPAAIVAVAGLTTMWSTALGSTCSDAVPVLPAFVPVTVCGPVTVAVHDAPVQEPFGEIENVVEAVTSPSELLEASKPSAV